MKANSKKVPDAVEGDVDEDVQPFIKRRLFLPEGRCSHSIIQVNGNEISAISVRQMKVDTNKIIDDHKKRMLPRFRYQTSLSQSNNVNIFVRGCIKVRCWRVLLEYFLYVRIYNLFLHFLIYLII